MLIPCAGLAIVAGLLTPALDASNSLERSLAIGFGGIAAALLYAAACCWRPSANAASR